MAITEALQGAAFVTGEAPIICLGVLDVEAKNLRFEYGARRRKCATAITSRRWTPRSCRLM